MTVYQTTILKKDESLKDIDLNKIAARMNDLHKQAGDQVPIAVRIPCTVYDGSDDGRDKVVGFAKNFSVVGDSLYADIVSTEDIGVGKRIMCAEVFPDHNEIAQIYLLGERRKRNIVLCGKPFDRRSTGWAKSKQEAEPEADSPIFI